MGRRTDCIVMSAGYRLAVSGEWNLALPEQATTRAELRPLLGLYRDGQGAAARSRNQWVSPSGLTCTAGRLGSPACTRAKIWRLLAPQTRNTTWRLLSSTGNVK